jgi:hypothetical protein
MLQQSTTSAVSPDRDVFSMDGVCTWVRIHRFPPQLERQLRRSAWRRRLAFGLRVVLLAVVIVLVGAVAYAVAAAGN